MDYEKKYNEALERAKKFEEKYGGGYAEYIFPELAESEDERIRKEIIFIVKEYGRICEKEGDPCCTIGDCLAYLEKQKEQKPVDYDHEMWKNCEANFEGGKKEVIEHPEKYGLQKPTEWSEWDEIVYKSIQTILLSESRFVEERKWFNSLPERFNLQPKQEWSEEDEEMLEYVIGDLNDAKQLFSAKDAKDLCDKEIAWLKSLRNRPKSSDTWKPSEEQMKALEAATVRYQSTGLESLYEELKKL